MCEAVSKALTPTLSESLISISELHIPVLLCVGLKENRDFLVISAFLKKGVTPKTQLILQELQELLSHRFHQMNCNCAAE